MSQKKPVKRQKRRTPEEIEMDREIEADPGFQLNLAFELARDGENTLAYFFLGKHTPRKKKAFAIISEAERQLRGSLQCLRKARKTY